MFIQKKTDLNNIVKIFKIIKLQNWAINNILRLKIIKYYYIIKIKKALNLFISNMSKIRFILKKGVKNGLLWRSI